MTEMPLHLKVLADDRHKITYRPAFAKITGSVLGAILLQQVLFRFDANGGQKFYKFMQPCKHPKYKDDDSWTEELGFSRYELAAALKAIATKSTAGATKSELMAVVEPKFNDKGNMENAPNLVIYWTDSSRVTWFWLNAILLGNAVMQHYLGNAAKQNYLVIPQSNNTYEKLDNRNTYSTENTKDKRIKAKPTKKTKSQIEEEAFRLEWAANAVIGDALLDVFDMGFVSPANQTAASLTPYLDVARELTAAGATVEEVPYLHKFVAAKSRKEAWSVKFGVRALSRYYTDFLRTRRDKIIPSDPSLDLSKPVEITPILMRNVEDEVAS